MTKEILCTLADEEVTATAVALEVVLDVLTVAPHDVAHTHLVDTVEMPDVFTTPVVDSKASRGGRHILPLPTYPTQ